MVAPVDVVERVVAPPLLVVLLTAEVLSRLPATLVYSFLEDVPLEVAVLVPEDEVVPLPEPDTDVLAVPPLDVEEEPPPLMPEEFRLLLLALYRLSL